MQKTQKNESIFDFNDGKGLVPAHRHANGGGWVSDTALVDESVYVGPHAIIHGCAKIKDDAFIDEYADVAGYCTIEDQVCIRGRAVIRGSCQILEHAEVSGNVFLAGQFKIGGYRVLSGNQCYYDMSDCLSCPAMLDDNYTASHDNPCLDCIAKYKCQKQRQSLGGIAIGAWLKKNFSEAYKIHEEA